MASSPPSSPPHYQPLQLSSKKKQKYKPLQHPLTKATLKTIKNERIRRGRRWDVVRTLGTRVFFGDCKSKKYEWLELGWVVEERHMPEGRIYRYYYDPSGFRYDKKHRVEEACVDMRREFGSVPGDVLPGREQVDESQPEAILGGKADERLAGGHVANLERDNKSSTAGLGQLSGLGLLAIHGPESVWPGVGSPMRVESVVAHPTQSRGMAGSHAGREQGANPNPNSNPYVEKLKMPLRQ